MIERMKKLTLLAVASERKALLKDLMLLGCVELSEQGDPQEVFPALREMDQSDLAAEKARHAELTNALKLLDKYAPAKKSLLAPLPEAGMGELLDESTLDADVALAEQLAELEERIRRATAEEGRERAAIEALQPWAGLDMPLGYRGTERAAVSLCSFPAALDMAGEDIFSAHLSAPVLIVAGSEAHGVRESVLRASRKVLALPMTGGMESLNVAVAAGVAMYNVFSQSNNR